ncbi:MAG: glycosyltransferase family 8 protein [Calothrix sp. MO_192.B10]|nr:glycosyltransferase family 8 protein [Calothrix sp. MO_192.B10]
MTNKLFKLIPIICKVAPNRFHRDVALQRLYNQYKLHLHTETLLAHSIKRMEVLFCFDINYEQHFGSAMTSLILNNKNKIKRIHIIIDRASLKLRHKLDIISNKYQLEFCIYEIDVEQFYNLKLSAHASAANYFRLLAADVLPQSLDKILYLDSDLIVNGSLDELFDLDISNYPLAASGSKVITTKKRLQMQGDYYFNSGVMLINLDYWRQNNLGFKALDFIRNNPNMILLWDQDALNKVIDGNFLPLNSKWNSLLDLDKNQSQVKEESVIIHFVGSLKPWHIWCMNPHKKIYWDYLKQSCWSNSMPTLPKNFKQALSAIRYIITYLFSS